MDGYAIFCMAWSTGGIPPSWAVCICAGVLVGLGLTIIVVLLQVNEIECTAPKSWTGAVDMISDACYGYPGIRTSTSFDCQSIVAFLTSLASTLLIDGLN